MWKLWFAAVAVAKSKYSAMLPRKDDRLVTSSEKEGRRSGLSSQQHMILAYLYMTADRKKMCSLTCSVRARIPYISSEQAMLSGFSILYPVSNWRDSSSGWSPG